VSYRDSEVGSAGLRLSQAQALLAAIVDSSEDAIVSKTLDGRIQSWNAGAERLFGYTAEEAIGQSVLLIIPPERAAEEDDILARIRSGERIGHFETVRLTKDGRRIDVSLTISPIRDSAGRVIGASKIARDITPEKRAVEAMREADRVKDEFLAILAHELRNRLAPIRNALEVLSIAGPIPTEAQPAVDLIDRQTTQMIRLVNDLMDVSRVSRNELKLRKKRVKLSDVLRDAFEVSRPLIDEREHVLTVSEAPRAIYVEVDRVRLAQAIINLLNNAARYTERGGRIWLRADREGDHAVVTVGDNGAGIAPEHLPHLFEMFVRADGSHDGPPRGLGVGLTLVKRIVELHGGSVEARSEGRGKGSEFELRVPLAKGRPRQTPPSSAASTARRILVVDDDRELANSLAMGLTALGHEVRTAQDGGEVVELAHEFRPHAIALDASLPTMSGFEVVAELRRHAWSRKMVLIAVTGWDETEARERALEAGFDHYVVKPIGAASLLSLLDALT